MPESWPLSRGCRRSRYTITDVSTRPPDWRLLLPVFGADHLVEGNSKSPARVLIFEDLQCPDCAGFRVMLDKQILPKFGARVAFEHQDFPLPKHNWARKAAIASRYFESVKPALAVEYRQTTMAHLTEALRSRGAWLLAPYEDLPSSSGLNTAPVEEIEKTAQYAIAKGFQLCVHAIGDRANREVLDIFERTFQANPEKAKGLRWRIEHSQYLSAADIPRFGKMGVIASMEGVRCTSDAPYVLARLGSKRAEEGAYVWRSLMDSGAIIANGTDAPSRGRGSDPLAVCLGVEEAPRRDGLLPEAAHDADGSIAELHDQRGLRGV